MAHALVLHASQSNCTSLPWQHSRPWAVRNWYVNDPGRFETGSILLQEGNIDA
jgi:hypothetical protein